MTDTTLEAARRWVSAYENHPLTTSGEVTMRFARAYVTTEADNARLRAALETIKRDNAQYNFGSKLLRIVNSALAPPAVEPGTEETT